MNSLPQIQFVNLTRFTIEIWAPGEIGADEFHPSGCVAELKKEVTPKASVYGIPMRNRATGPVLNLPEPRQGTIFIVTPGVAKVVKRPDVVAPFGAQMNPMSADKVLVAEGFESFCDPPQTMPEQVLTA